jgi:hypothetical protein
LACFWLLISIAVIKRVSCVLQDFLKLGPLELKLLNVSGRRMPIHRPPSPPDDLAKSTELRPDRWPVTHEMLRQTLRHSPRDASADNSAASSVVLKTGKHVTVKAT